MNAKRSCGGLTTLEFSLALAVIVVLAWFALDRLQLVEETSEMTVVDATVRNVATGLRYGMSDAIIHGQEASVAEWAGSNPVRWLKKLPEGYLGEFAGAPPRPAAGTWWFDTQHRQLCYLPKLVAHLVVSDGTAELCWRIEVAGGMAVLGAAPHVVATHPYRWF